MAERLEVTVTIDDRKITLEGPEPFVREEVERLVRLNTIPREIISSQRPPSGQIPDPCREKELIQEKLPSGHAETVAVLAFCLTEQGNPEFTPEDMRRAYIRANVRPPKVVAQSLRDAKNKYDLIKAGSARGTFRLSSHGERTVRFDLPRTRGAS